MIQPDPPEKTVWVMSTRAYDACLKGLAHLDAHWNTLIDAAKARDAEDEKKQFRPLGATWDLHMMQTSLEYFRDMLSVTIEGPVEFTRSEAHRFAQIELGKELDPIFGRLHLWGLIHGNKDNGNSSSGPVFTPSVDKIAGDPALARAADKLSGV